MIAPDDAFYRFQRTYLCVYLLATASDWMQGPYIYALYDAYGLSTHDIEVLFVAGYASSMVFGTVVGSVADKYGRRKNCLVFAALYGLSCFTKHFNSFSILLVGRLLSGVSTSLLCSAFESWMVCEFHKEGFDSNLLSSIFSHVVIGNSLVAIFSGIMAQATADQFGYVAPFDMAIFLLLVLSLLIVFSWGENYGDQTAKPLQNFKTALATIRSNRKILCLGLIQMLFEGSMYTFVLEWTPALMATERETSAANEAEITSGTQQKTEDDHHVDIPYGYIFSSFMVAIMIGSSLFKLLSRATCVESFMRPVLLLSSVALMLPILFPKSQIIVLLSFILFEICVGIFWPSLGTMRGKYIPEANRATIMNLFRVPLNLIVVVVLTQNFPMPVIFQCCVVFLMVASLCQVCLHRMAINELSHS